MTSKQLTEGNHDYRPLLKEIKKSEETHIVLDCDFERIPGILHQANEIELLTDYHNYLVTTLDMDKINLEKYKDMVRMGKRICANNAEERGIDFLRGQILRGKHFDCGRDWPRLSNSQILVHKQQEI